VSVQDRFEGKNRFRHGQIHGKPLLQPWREANLYVGLVAIEHRY